MASTAISLALTECPAATRASMAATPLTRAAMSRRLLPLIIGSKSMADSTHPDRSTASIPGEASVALCHEPCLRTMKGVGAELVTPSAAAHTSA